MNSNPEKIRVAMPPSKPLVIFDGDCRFCASWSRRRRRMTGESVDYLPAQDSCIPAQFPEIPSEQLNKAVQLIEADGMVYSGVEAVFRVLARNPSRRWALRCYKKSPAFACVTKWIYGFVAGHRRVFPVLMFRAKNKSSSRQKAAHC